MIIMSIGLYLRIMMRTTTGPLTCDKRQTLWTGWQGFQNQIKSCAEPCVERTGSRTSFLCLSLSLSRSASLYIHTHIHVLHCYMYIHMYLRCVCVYIKIQILHTYIYISLSLSLCLLFSYLLYLYTCRWAPEIMSLRVSIINRRNPHIQNPNQGPRLRTLRQSSRPKFGPKCSSCGFRSKPPGTWIFWLRNLEPDCGPKQESEGTYPYHASHGRNSFFYNA